MTPEHEERLREIEERANAATGNKWLAFSPYRDPGARTQYHGIKNNGKTMIASAMREDDALFAAHARADIPWVIDRLREAEEDGRQRRRCLQALPVYGKVKGDASTDYEGQGDAEAPIPHCKISELHLGDTLVFKYPGPLDKHAEARLRKFAVDAFGLGSGRRVIVLDGGLDLEIVRPKSTAESETNRAAAMILAQIEAEADMPGKGE